MEDFVIFIIVILVLAIAGTLTYFIIDYSKYKKETNSTLDASTTNIDANRKDIKDETMNRMSNVKYVVQQVNKVNTDIYSAVTSNTSNIKDVKNIQDKSLRNVGTFLKFTSNTSVNPNISTPGSSIPLMDLPGSGNINMQLMQRVNATMGLTATDLSPSKSVQFCASSDPKRCVKIPADNGDLYFTTMTSNKSSTITMDAPYVKATGQICINKTCINESNLVALNNLSKQVNTSAINLGDKWTIGTEGSNLVIRDKVTSGDHRFAIYPGLGSNTNLSQELRTSSINLIDKWQVRPEGSTLVLRDKVTSGDNRLAITPGLGNATNISKEFKTSTINFDDKWKVRSAGSILVFRDNVTGGDNRYAMLPGIGNKKNL